MATMLVCKKALLYPGDRWHNEVRFKPGISRVSSDSSYARRFPAYFEPAGERSRSSSIRVLGTVESPEGSLLRSADSGAGDEAIGTLHGHFAVFNVWTQINGDQSWPFMERIAPGSCRRSFEEDGKKIRCLFQHGRDPQIGMKPLGPITELVEDEVGCRYEVAMADTAYNRDLLPILRSGQLGASFRFAVVREDIVAKPQPSAHNPGQLEERTVMEMRVREFGPVTFPAYPEATAGVRSSVVPAKRLRRGAALGSLHTSVRGRPSKVGAAPWQLSKSGLGALAAGR